MKRKDSINIAGLFAIVLFTLVSFGSQAQTVLVEAGATWKYLDDGSDQGTAWKETNFNDSSWSSGQAELGYGDGDEKTVISYGNDPDNKHITYYFRHSFNVSNPSETPNLSLEILRDDGAVVYINGTEVQRTNMPDGNINYQTLASSTVSGSDEDKFFQYVISSGVLTQGSNLIAVEVHQRSATSSDVSFNLKLSFTNDTEPVYRKAPYLIFSGNNDEMMVLWQLYDTHTSTLQWGTDQTYSTGSTTTSEYGNDHQHKYTITNLNLSTKYYFRVITEGDTVKGDFVTGPPNDVTDITLIAYGDTRTYPSDHDGVAERILDEFANDPGSQTIILMSGDLVSDGDKEEDWDNEFFDPQYTHIQKMLRSAPLMACVGNHEANGSLFSKYFPYPFYASGDYYWSFDYGPVHVAILDQYSPYTEGTPQYNWLVNDLASSDKKWKILVFHKPGWSAGGHSNDEDVQKDIQPLCEKYGVQFVINGHNHYYSRAYVNRVEHITTGGGGAPLYDPNPNYPNIVTTNKSYHFTKLKIEGDTLVFTAIKSDGTVIEEFEYNRVYYWTGEDDTNWGNGNNWAMKVVPRSFSDVVIPSGLTNYPEIKESAVCNEIELKSGAKLTILDSGQLKIHSE